MRRHDRFAHQHQRFSRHAYMGRDDDRDDPERRTHDPRAGWAPLHGLHDEEHMYSRRDEREEGLWHAPREALPFGAGPLFDSPFDALGASVPYPRQPQRRPDPQWQTRDESRTSYVSSAGRGPRSYKRSDARIYEEVCEALAADDEVDVGDVEVRVQDGEVTLSGLVPEREMKWRVEDIAADVRGVNDVKNLVRVDRRGEARP